METGSGGRKREEEEEGQEEEKEGGGHPFLPYSYPLHRDGQPVWHWPRWEGGL